MRIRIILKLLAVVFLMSFLILFGTTEMDFVYTGF